VKVQTRSVAESIFVISSRWRLATMMFEIVLSSTLAAGTAGFPLDLAGVTVTPHLGTPNVLFRRPPLAPLDVRGSFSSSTASWKRQGALACFFCDRQSIDSFNKQHHFATCLMAGRSGLNT
jgi:hypothetical protein